MHLDVLFYGRCPAEANITPFSVGHVASLGIFFIDHHSVFWLLRYGVLGGEIFFLFNSSGGVRGSAVVDKNAPIHYN